MAITKNVSRHFANAKNYLPHFLSGDTLIEVMFAVGIFGIVSISAISVMNRGLQNAQGNLETTMARQEIDAQSESIRFIHDAYVAEKSTANNRYAKIWGEILKRAYNRSELIAESASFYSGYSGNIRSCAQLYQALPKKSFVINPRVLSASDVKNIASGLNGASISDLIISKNPSQPNDVKLGQTATYPRLLYGNSRSQANSANISDATATTLNYNKNVFSAEGIWVTAVNSASGIDCSSEGGEFRPDYYDFHIRTCWDSPDGNSATTIGSTVRVFNPDQITIEARPSMTNVSHHVDWQHINQTATSAGACGLEPTEHVVIRDSGLEFHGYTSAAMNEGVEYAISANDGFEFDADIDTSQLQTGTGDNLKITLGIVSIVVNKNGGNVYIRGESMAHVDSQFRLKMSVTNSGHYEIYLDGAIVGMANTATHDNTTFSIYLTQNTHCSTAISHAYITNLQATITADQEKYETMSFCSTTYRSTYTVVFDANGGSGTMSHYTFNTGENSQLPINTFIYTGYTFSNWNLAPDNSSTSYPDNGYVKDLTEPSKTITLYAQWRDAYYHVNFNANGGSGSMDTQTIRLGSMVPLSNNTFTRNNYHFVGWNTKANGTGTSYSNRQAVMDIANLDEAITLYAQWRFDAYYVIFQPNGADGSPSIQTINRGVNTALLPNRFFRNGMRFDGWNTKADGSGTKYADRQQVLNLASVDGYTILYAQWSRTDVWVDVNEVINGTVYTSGSTGFTFDVYLDGVKVADDVKDYYTPIAGGSTIRVVANPHDGYTLVNADVSQVAMGTLEFNPTWNSSNYQIIFMANDGTSTNNVQYAPINTSVKLATNTFTRTGYKFGGWATKADGSGTSYSQNQIVYNIGSINHPATLYAVWLPDGSSPSTKTCAELGFPTMQDWTNNGKLKKVGDTTRLCDSRDSIIYPVAMLEDGKIWMTTNLQLDFSKMTNNMSAANTNNPASSFVSIVNNKPAATDGGFNMQSSESVKYSTYHLSRSTSTYGVYYNWYTATAGTGTKSMTNTNVSGDICPKGWHLPTGGQAGEFYELDLAMGSGNRFSGTPASFFYSGYVGGYSVYSIGAYGLYWSSTTAANTGNAYSLYLNSGGQDLPGTSSAGRHFGYSVRCVAN